MRANATATDNGSRGRNRYRRPLPSLAERAQTLYAGIPDEVYARLPQRLKDDVRRGRSSACSCHPSLAQRGAEEARAFTIAGDLGYADNFIQLIRDAAIDPYQDSLPHEIADVMMTAQAKDAGEDVLEVEAYRTRFLDRAAVLRLADAKAQSARAESIAAAALRRHAETLR